MAPEIKCTFEQFTDPAEHDRVEVRVGPRVRRFTQAYFRDYSQYFNNTEPLTLSMTISRSAVVPKEFACIAGMAYHVSGYLDSEGKKILHGSPKPSGTCKEIEYWVNKTYVHPATKNVTYYNKESPFYEGLCNLIGSTIKDKTVYTESIFVDRLQMIWLWYMKEHSIDQSCGPLFGEPLVEADYAWIEDIVTKLWKECIFPEDLLAYPKILELATTELRALSYILTHKLEVHDIPLNTPIPRRGTISYNKEAIRSVNKDTSYDFLKHYDLHDVIVGDLTKQLVIAGGALTNYFVGNKETDIDIYLLCPKDKRQSVIEDFIRKLSNKGLCRAFRISQWAGSFEWTSSTTNHRHKIQIVRMDINNIKELIEDFDMDACRIAWNDNRIYFTEKAAESIESGVIEVNYNRLSYAHFFRLNKYWKKGFRLLFKDVKWPSDDFETSLFRMVHRKIFIAKTTAFGKRGDYGRESPEHIFSCVKHRFAKKLTEDIVIEYPTVAVDDQYMLMRMTSGVTQAEVEQVYKVLEWLQKNRQQVLPWKNIREWVVIPRTLYFNRSMIMNLDEEQEKNAIEAHKKRLESSLTCIQKHHLLQHIAFSSTEVPILIATAKDDCRQKFQASLLYLVRNTPLSNNEGMWFIEIA